MTHAPFFLLLAYAGAFAATALGTSLVAFDDHPGQLARVWHVVTLGPAPWAWNWGWWTGYPEMQFYPPGFAYAGALLHWGSAGLVAVDAAYQALLWLAYVAPGLTAYLALARLLGSGWLALPGAFAALTLSLWPGLMSGVEGGVHVGMAPARLGWALLPLLLFALVGWIDGAARFPARWVVALVALVVLTHPAHLPAAVVLVLLAAVGARPRGRRLMEALGWLGVAALVTAFWTLPLLARLDNARALAWGELSWPSIQATVSAHPLVLALVVLALWAIVRVRVAGSRAAGVLVVFPWAAALVVVVDRLALEPVGIRWLPADRVTDGFWMALVLAAGLGWSGVGSSRYRDVLVGLVGIVVLVLASTRGDTLTLWPRAGTWPTFAAIERGLRLPALWTALQAAPEGRALFVRSAVPLRYGPEWWRPHTHVTALTPVFTGRGIVHGTFTHPSPVAALVYRGSPEGGAITELVERLDGHSLFGRPLDSLDPTTFNGLVRRLGVSVVVALEDDAPRLAALADNPMFATRRAEPPFVLWLGPPAALPHPAGAGRWQISLEAFPGGWTPARLAYYPLWQASAGSRALETRRGTAGDLEVNLPPGSTTVDLTYRPLLADWSGLALTALGLGISAFEPRFRRRSPPPRRVSA